MKFDIEKRIFLVKMFYKLGHLSSVQKAFRTHFNNHEVPSFPTIKNIISNFEKIGSVGLLPRKPKEPTQKRENAKKQLESMVSDFETFSIRKAASAIGVSPTLIYHILHDDLHLKPYKFHQWHKLEDQDYQKRLDFAQWFQKSPVVLF